MQCLIALRTVLAPSLEKLGIVFAKTGLSPNVWTAIGLILSLAAAVSYTSSEWVQGVQAWHAITIGSILLLASGFFDSYASCIFEWHRLVHSDLRALISWS